MNAITLTLPKETYKQKISQKSELLDKVVMGYSRVIKYGISEWTTRGIFSIGKAYEDFALALFKQQRPESLSLDERLALELGIAKAVEEYFVNKAAHFYEQNVKLSIKEKIEDKYVLDSRAKLTSLPYLAGANYLALVEIAQNATTAQKLEGFAQIAKKLETLQKIGPFQERAITLFMKSLENGSMYHQQDESYALASSNITKTSFTVGQTYADIAVTAREAPVPGAFDPYEGFVYKTKLLKQIETYEDKSLENYLRTVKIAEAYKIEDDYVKQTRNALARLLFERGRCYDVLAITAFRTPPYPSKATEPEKEEYKGRFEEIGLQFQENAYEAYKTIIEYAKRNYTTGDYVTHAYIRMFQASPKIFGVKSEKTATLSIKSDGEWKCIADTNRGWATLEYNDALWKPVQKVSLPPGTVITGLPDKTVQPMWFGETNPSSQQFLPQVAFRRVFYNYDMLKQADLYITGIDDQTVYLNEQLLLPSAADTFDFRTAKHWDLMGKMREGKNLLAVYVKNNMRIGCGLLPLLTYTVVMAEYLPQPPGVQTPLDVKKVAEGTWTFPGITNFSVTPAIAPEKGKQP
jgi:hypothetical protein